MAMMKTRAGFVDTEKGIEIRHKLHLMTQDDTYNTTSSYSANDLSYPDNRIPFVDKHMNYLVGHPMLDPDKYIANVRLITRKR
jgi:hypothetical protein